MGTDETTGDDPVDDETTDETTDEIELEDAEVSGLAMGLPSPLGSIAPGLGAAESTIHVRKAGEHPVEYLKVTMEDVQITGNL
jgi:hypothetical protein